MTPGEYRSHRSEARSEETAKARRVSKRPYVRPSVACQDLEHVVQGQTGPALDGVSGRVGKSRGG